MVFRTMARAHAARLTAVAFVALALAACSTSAEINYTGTQKGFDRSARFAVAETVDKSGFVFEDKSEAFALDTAFAEALATALADEGISGSEDGTYTLKSEIVRYKPGNAFARWLLPGAGATELDTVTHVYDSRGNEVAALPVSTMIAAGGGYTIGADKTVFNDNAGQVADKLHKSFNP